MSLLLTLVRHGESTDNLKALWAGHRDAPLTTHGMNQARRLGKFLEDEYISKIYASDLKRAHWTALQIATQNKSLIERLRQDTHDSQSVNHAAAETSTRLAAVDDFGTSTPHQRRHLESDQLDLEDGDVKQVAETSAGPSSFATTDRAADASAAGVEYRDDFSCSSSAAASSPLASPATTGSLPSEQQARALLPKTVTTTDRLREQYFGLAEGQNWKTGFGISANAYKNRAYKFDQGESLDDVHARAEEIIQRCIVPWLVKSSKNDNGGQEHIVLVAHGIMISELLFALHRLQDPRVPYERRSGHTNTGWTRFTLSFPPNISGPDVPLADPILPDITSPELPARYDVASIPRVTIKQTHANMTDHLTGLKRTKGGVGSEGYDARQKSLRDFFGGGAGGTDTPSNGSITESNGDNGAVPEHGNSTNNSRAVPDPRPIDLTGDDHIEGFKTNGEHQRRGIRMKSPTSPSPKKSRLT